MQSPRVFIPQVIERWDPTNERFEPAHDFSTAAEYGMIMTILERNDNPIFLARLIPKIKDALHDFNDDDYFVAVGDPSVIAICTGLILRRSTRLKLLKWDRRTGRYIAIQLERMTEQIDYFEDLPEAPKPPATLERLIGLANDAKVLEAEVIAATIALSEKQDRLDKILRERIPDIMEELALEDFTLKDGSKIVVKDEVKASISEERKPVAFEWLRANDFDGIIKTAVTAAFGKGDAAEAEKAKAVLIAAGFDAEVIDSVHHTTLKSFVKEQLEAGTNIPLDVFGVYQFKVAKITPPKAPKASTRK